MKLINAFSLWIQSKFFNMKTNVECEKEINFNALNLHGT